MEAESVPFRAAGRLLLAWFRWVVYDFGVPGFDLARQLREALFAGAAPDEAAVRRWLTSSAGGDDVSETELADALTAAGFGTGFLGGVVARGIWRQAEAVGQAPARLPVNGVAQVLWQTLSWRRPDAPAPAVSGAAPAADAADAASGAASADDAAPAGAARRSAPRPRARPRRPGPKK